MGEIFKRYRLTLDFSVLISDDILQPSSDEDELEEEEKKRLKAERTFMEYLLADQQGIREELIKKKILEETQFEAGYEDLRKLLLIRNYDKDELLLEPILDKLLGDDWNYFQEAREQENFEGAASEVLSCFGVELEGASLVEIDEEEEE